MNKNDLISRSALLGHVIPVYGVHDDSAEFDAVAVGYIAGAPAIDPEELRPKGKWIKHDDYTECSVCEYWYDSPEAETEDDRPKYCPNCGAKNS